LVQGLLTGAEQFIYHLVPGAQDAALFGWLQTLYPIWARFGPEEMFVSAQVGLAELALSNCLPVSWPCVTGL
jgi:hypothetical protein